MLRAVPISTHVGSNWRCTELTPNRPFLRREVAGPPESLTAPERELFLRIVGTNKPAHFQPSDTPLMCRYVEAVIMAERAAEELRQNPVVNGKASPWLVI